MTLTAQILIALISSIAGIGSLIFGIAFYRTNKRLKKAEATLKETEVKKAEYEITSELINDLVEDRERRKTEKKEQDEKIQRLEKRINDFEVSYIEIEKENHIYKRAGNAGYRCEIPRDNCPIHLKFYELKNSNNDNTASTSKD